jgi:hypothetical protein
MEKYAGQFVRLMAVMVMAMMAMLSVQSASAQTATLNVVIQTDDGSEIPAGEVCIRGEGTPLCQEVGGNPSGREFSFGELQNGVEYNITVNAGDYLEAVASANLTDGTTTVTITLEREQTPSNLPDTGSGAALASTTMSTTLVVVAGSSLVLAMLGLMLRRREG